LHSILARGVVPESNQTPYHLRYSFVGLSYNQTIMSTTLPSSTTSEYATTETAETYDHWFRAKVLASLNDDRPARPHDTVMAQLKKIVAAGPDDHAADSMEG
jgi:hypothetical protein